MLTDLRVRDLGVIEDITLALGPGMVALTGETGTGKTLLVEALQLALGGRADSGLVRAGAPEALVEARFVIRATKAEPEREVVLARSVPQSGRSRAWVDGRMVPVATLAEVGAELVDIHGQHDHQSLLAPAAPRRALDAFAGTDLSALREARQRQRELEGRLAAMGGDEQQRAREMDVLGHQLSEIEAAALEHADEDVRLLEEEARLADLSAHRQAAAVALMELDGTGSGEESTALASLGRAVEAVSGRTPFDGLVAQLRGVLADAADVASDLRRAVDTWEDDPERLAEVQARRRLLADLRHKYGATLLEVMEFAKSAAKRLDDLAAAEDNAAALQDQLSQVEAELARAESSVRQTRAQAGPVLAAAVGARLGDLAMENARLEVEVGQMGSGEPVRFLLGANPGEPVQPLAKVASGGELARAMLALRLVAMGGPATMIFDEVDAGVGGEAALALARALREVARDRQVLVVTHLAQVAAFADTQVAVEKFARGGRTLTEARVLGTDDRVVELSRMLSGHPDSATARAHALELLETGQQLATSTIAPPVVD